MLRWIELHERGSYDLTPLSGLPWFEVPEIRPGILILELYFGLGTGSRWPLRQIGPELGISRERVRQLKDRALDKVKEKLGEDLRG